MSSRRSCRVRLSARPILPSRRLILASFRQDLPFPSLTWAKFKVLAALVEQWVTVALVAMLSRLTTPIILSSTRLRQAHRSWLVVVAAVKLALVVRVVQEDRKT